MADNVIIGVFLILCLAWQANAAVNCTLSGEGRHADPDDTTCQNYTLCVYDSTSGAYLSYNYVCPTTSVFNPSISQCTASSNYVCNVTATTTTATSTTTTLITTTPITTTPITTTPITTTPITTSPFTTTPITTTPITTTPITTTITTITTTTTTIATTTATPSLCTEDGYIPDPDSTNCTAYIECVDIDGSFIETPYTCPDDSYFDPNTTFCVYDYNCTATFTCSSEGRFPDPSDTTCKTYYLCVLASNGTYFGYNYTCPSTSVFSPTEQFCTTSYICT
ncbi:uncharacterized protein LOC113523561 [Galleria mellonella]|uniref:Uncharacterized protein LOC113523561 n=1 Tax=Galleria mellonella TaxID=7137 RepID=A0A6J3BUS7_GALME|nr:uncharacterized protein LOC113523561 [Galleria mellonella]